LVFSCTETNAAKKRPADAAAPKDLFQAHQSVGAKMDYLLFLPQD
jgi:hypothetical protein